MSATRRDKLFLQVSARNGYHVQVEQIIREVEFDMVDSVNALEIAAGGGHVEVLRVLTKHGVRDTGSALVRAFVCCQERALRFLVKQYEIYSLDYVRCTKSGPQLMLYSIENFRTSSLSSLKMFRWLLDMGANTRQEVQVVANAPGQPEIFRGSVMSFLDQQRVLFPDEKKLDATKRMLLREPAIHAVSWLWPSTKSCTKLSTQWSTKWSTKWKSCTKSSMVLGALLSYTKK